jgi:peptidoglycan hydrolase-like protein with peptidoglycan-binding domain
LNIRIILALSTMIGITFGSLPARQTEAAVSQNFSRYYIARANIEATLALEKQRQAEEAERQRLAVAESRTEANLTDAEPIPAGELVKVGARDARVPMIRARMVKLGFLSEENSFAWMLGHPADKVSNPRDLESILDKELSKAIKAFQKANGIKQTGRIDKATVAALNAAEAAEKQRQAEEERKTQVAAVALAKQRQAEEAEEERKAQVAALALAKQRQAEEAERQRLAAEAAAKQRQAEEERKAQVAALALAKQRQAEEAERQRLAAEAAAKQRQAEEERKAQLATLAKQRQAEEAERLADKGKVASIDSASEANEASSKSCDKAKSIIGKYGFEDIETESCKGKIYHFLASRKGKRFSVKIDALTSELTEVKSVLSSAAE